MLSAGFIVDGSLSFIPDDGVLMLVDSGMVDFSVVFVVGFMVVDSVVVGFMVVDSVVVDFMVVDSVVVGFMVVGSLVDGILSVSNFCVADGSSVFSDVVSDGVLVDVLDAACCFVV